MMNRICVCTGLMLFFTSCNLFEKQEQAIETVHSTDGKTVKFYYVGLGATTKDVIQVRKVDKDNKEILIHAYEHNFLNSAKFVTKDSLMFVLSDTTMYGPSKKRDTVGIAVNNL